MTFAPSRRSLLAAAAALAGGAVAGGAGAAGWPADRLADWLADWPEVLPGGKPSCVAPATATPRQTEGPFFRPDSPLRRDLRAEGAPGRPLDLLGRLTGRDCRPLAGAVVELWHADAEGRYDNAGYRFRGHQTTDAEGRFGFRTIVPGLYRGRTRHYHLILAPGPGGGRPLTTQLYFPEEPGNARDRLFDPALQLRLAAPDGQLLGRYDFVLG